jgi:hypothetical protein
MFADVPLVVRATSREIEPGTWQLLRVGVFEVEEMLSDEVKGKAMATFSRILTRLRQTMREGHVYRLQREQRNIVCFELPEPVDPFITYEELEWLTTKVRAEREQERAEREQHARRSAPAATSQADNLRPVMPRAEHS